jgi:histidinol-phosphate/aromatic aminotransferase/cobyric acid decarboxylase-like protein
MIKYRKDLLAKSDIQNNYAFTHHARTDLSLVSAPYVWDMDLADFASEEVAELVNKYGKPNGEEHLINGLAALEGVDPDWIMVTSGADVGIEVVCKQFLGCGTEAAILIPTFPRYEIVISALERVQIEYFEDLDNIARNYNLIALCSPNNPTTDQINVDKLRAKLEQLRETLFCIDAALGIYGDVDFVDLVKIYKNIVVLKSFSKLGLAGLRLGYIVSQPRTIQYLKTAQSPFSVPRLIQLLGIKILQQYERVDQIHKLVETSWRQIYTAFGNNAVRKSAVPFYLLKVKIPSEKAVEILNNYGISVVDGKYFRGLDGDYLRVALGNTLENDILINAVLENDII